MTNDRYFGKTDPLLGVSLCTLCARCRSADCTLFLSAGCNAGAKTVFLHWRRTVSCGVWGYGYRRRAANHQRNASCDGHHNHQRRATSAYRAEHENQGRCSHCHDLGGGTCHRLSADEYFFHLV